MRSVRGSSDEQTPAIMLPRVFGGAIKKSDEGGRGGGDRPRRVGEGGGPMCMASPVCQSEVRTHPRHGRCTQAWIREIDK